MKRKFLQIRDIATDDVVKEIDISIRSEAYVDNLENGLYQKTDLEKFYITRIEK